MTNDTSLTFADELDWGIRLQKAGVFDEAADTYSEILRQSPLHPEASFLLGSIELERRELGPACLHLAVAAGGLEAPDEAQAGFARAYEALDPASRGGVLSEIAEMLIAQDAGDRAAPALRVLRLLGETEAALSLTETVLVRFPEAGELLRIRGQLLHDSVRRGEALVATETALEVLSDDCELLTAHSAMLAREGRPEEALTMAHRAAESSLTHEGADVRRAALIQLMSCHIELRQLGTARAELQDYQRRAPNLPETWIALARCLHLTGHHGDAETALGEARNRFPDHLEIEWLHCIYALAPIYRSISEISDSRERYALRLTALAKRVAETDAHNRSRARLLAHDLTPYLLPYQYGEDDRRLQEIYGEMLVSLSEHTHLPTVSAARDDGRIAVAFVSGFVWRHTNWRMKRGWLKYLDHERFHVACLHLGERRDEMTVEIEGYCDAFHHLPSDYEGAVRVLAEMRPDIIFYPEVGMSGTAQRLAADRLAHVQCCAIGHPVTTGLSTIDYFVSGELIEPEGADAHYSERLVTLPGVSFPYMPTPLEEAGLARSHFDLPDDATLFLCLQTPQKYLPADDGLYARIAAEVPNALFVFLDGGSSMFDMSILRDRMVAAFRDMQLDPEQHLRFLPHLSPQKYQSLNALGDIYLDTPGWSGGNTTLEAIYQGLPIVTMRGREMRACVSAGMLALIGATETVADDDATFVDIAVRLAQDIDWRRSVRQKVIEGRTRLETAMESVRAMEDFFESAVADARKSQ